MGRFWNICKDFIALQKKKQKTNRLGNFATYCFAFIYLRQQGYLGYLYFKSSTYYSISFVEKNKVQKSWTPQEAGLKMCFMTKLMHHKTYCRRNSQTPSKNQKEVITQRLFNAFWCKNYAYKMSTTHKTF